MPHQLRPDQIIFVFQTSAVEFPTDNYEMNTVLRAVGHINSVIRPVEISFSENIIDFFLICLLAITVYSSDVIFNPTHDIANCLQKIFRILAIRQVYCVSPGRHPAVDDVEFRPKRPVLPKSVKTLCQSEQ